MSRKKCKKTKEENKSFAKAIVFDALKRTLKGMGIDEDKISKIFESDAVNLDKDLSENKGDE